MILLEPPFWEQVALPVEKGERPVSSGARDIHDTSGGCADVDGELPGSNAEGADSVSRALPVVSCAGDLALDPVVSTAAAFPGSRLLRVLGRGHSADDGGCSGAGIAACSSGIERLRRQACCNFRDFVGVFLIPCHLTMLTVCVHEVFVVMVTRIHVGTHMLHARIHVYFARCTQY